jgi:hypothetical protein
VLVVLVLCSVAAKSTCVRSNGLTTATVISYISPKGIKLKILRVFLSCLSYPYPYLMSVVSALVQPTLCNPHLCPSFRSVL